MVQIPVQDGGVVAQACEAGRDPQRKGARDSDTLTGNLMICLSDVPRMD